MPLRMNIPLPGPFSYSVPMGRKGRKRSGAGGGGLSALVTGSFRLTWIALRFIFLLIWVMLAGSVWLVCVTFVGLAGGCAWLWRRYGHRKVHEHGGGSPT